MCCVWLVLILLAGSARWQIGSIKVFYSYDNPPEFEPTVLAQHSVDGVHAELVQLDQDGEYFAANVYTVIDGIEDYLNNTGSVSYGEAFQAFGWDLDCFLNGASFDKSMFTDAYYHLTDDGLGGQD